MRRIAYASPVNPAPSGISDYSEELLPFLARYADITLYIDDRLRPSNPELAHSAALRPLGQLARDQRRRPYDAIIYHMGNSPAHAAIWGALQRVPGVVVLHEFVLHHFMLHYAATVRRDVGAYQAEAARRYGAEGERVARLMLRGRLSEAAFELPFCEDVLAAAEGLIAHSRYVLGRAAALRPGLPAAHVPMGVPLPPPIARAEARRRRGLPLDAPILASFGHINPYKRLEPALRAVQRLRERMPDLRYLLVGSVSPSYDLPALVARAGLDDVVTVTGYVERAAFDDYVAAADVCLNLRHPTAGETSASLLRLLGAGRPTLVTASGSFCELPPDVAAQVDPDVCEGDLIVAYCRRLLEQPALAAALGANAQAYVARAHTLDGAAQGYMRFLAQRYGWQEPIAPRGPEARDQESGVRSQEPGARSREPGETRQLPARLSWHTAAVAAALAGMGATEGDHALLGGAARALAELLGGER